MTCSTDNTATADHVDRYARALTTLIVFQAPSGAITNARYPGAFYAAARAEVNRIIERDGVFAAEHVTDETLERVVTRYAIDAFAWPDGVSEVEIMCLFAGREREITVERLV